MFGLAPDLPPIAIAELFPAEPSEPLPDDNCLFATAKDADVAQVVPSYCSVNSLKTVPGGVNLPPNTMAAVCVPLPPTCALALFKFPPEVQLVPSYSSV